MDILFNVQSLTDLWEACQTFNICTVLWALDTCKQPTANDPVVPLTTTIVRDRPSTKLSPTGLLYKTVGSFVAANSVTHFSGIQLRYSTLSRGKIFFFPLKRPEQHWGPSSPNLTGTRRCFPGDEAAVAWSDHSVPRLRISWPISQFPLYAFTAWTQAAHFHFDCLLCKGDSALSHRHRQNICHCVTRPTAFNISTVRMTLGNGSSVILQGNFLTQESCAGK
jgi:hypothetical protein